MYILYLHTTATSLLQTPFFSSVTSNHQIAGEYPNLLFVEHVVFIDILSYITFIQIVHVFFLSRSKMDKYSKGHQFLEGKLR